MPNEHCKWRENFYFAHVFIPLDHNRNMTWVFGAEIQHQRMVLPRKAFYPLRMYENSLEWKRMLFHPPPPPHAAKTTAMQLWCVMHCVFSYIFESELANSSKSQTSLCFPWASMTISPVYHCSHFGQPLTDNQYQSSALCKSLLRGPCSKPLKGLFWQFLDSCTSHHIPLPLSLNNI